MRYGGADIFKAKAARLQRPWISDDAHRRRLRPSYQHLRDAADLADARRHDEVAEIVEIGGTPDRGGHGQDHDRRGRGVRFPDGRPACQSRRKIGLRRVDGRLHIAGGVVSVPRQVELNLDACGAELARGRQLVDARNRSDVPLKRSGDGGRDGLGIGPRQCRADPHGGHVDAGKARHRQLEIGDDARKKEPDRKQDGPNRPLDEER